MMQVLAAVGWVLLALVILIALAILLPAQVLVDLRGGEWTLRARVLFLTFRLYPRRAKRQTAADAPQGNSGTEQKAPRQAEHSEKTEKKPAAKGKKKRRGLALYRIAESLRAAGGFIRRVLRFVRIRDVDLTLPVHDDDAALTAIRYGRVQASIGTIVAAARNLVRIDFRHVNIFADFDGVCEKQTAFSCKIGAPPVIIAIAAVWAYFRLTEAKVL